MTVADAKITAGLDPHAWTHETVVDGMRRLYWPAEVAHRPGWWWIVAFGDRAVAFAWVAGTVRDRNDDIKSAVARLRTRRSA